MNTRNYQRDEKKIAIMAAVNNKDWETVTTTLSKTPVIGGYKDGIRTPDKDGNYPIHRAIMFGAPLETLQCIYKVHRSLFFKANSYGNLPIHLACLHRANLDVIQCLCEEYEEGLRLPNQKGQLPIHCACLESNSLEVIRYLHQKLPDCFTRTTRSGDLPLHCTCAAKNPGIDVVLYIHQGYKDGIKTGNKNGDIPLHRVCQNGGSLDVAQYIYRAYPEGADKRNSHGETPFSNINKSNKCIDHKETLSKQLASDVESLKQKMRGNIVETLEKTAELEDLANFADGTLEKANVFKRKTKSKFKVSTSTGTRERVEKNDPLPCNENRTEEVISIGVTWKDAIGKPKLIAQWKTREKEKKEKERARKEEAIRKRQIEYRKQVEELVTKLFPGEVLDLDVMMDQFHGSEDELVNTLKGIEKHMPTQPERVASMTQHTPKKKQGREESNNSSTVDARWLIDMCSTVPSELGAAHLACAVWHASQLKDEASQQAALFDALGASVGAMEVLSKVAPCLDTIREKISLSDLSAAGVSVDKCNNTTVTVDSKQHKHEIVDKEVRSPAVEIQENSSTPSVVQKRPEPVSRGQLAMVYGSLMWKMGKTPLDEAPEAESHIDSNQKESTPTKQEDPLKIFVSYSRADWDGFVINLVDKLKMRHNTSVWLDQHLLVGGNDWMDSIAEALDECHVLILVMSPEALQSKFVKMEYRYFFNQDKPLIPILYREVEKLPPELSIFQYIDFTGNSENKNTNCIHESYDELFHILEKKEY